MPCSPEKLAACRNNGRKSRGPVTDEGKAALRRNALKHGLTGAGLALPTEDAAEVESLFVELEAELAPETELDRHRVQRVALATVRLKRAALQEAAALGQNVRHAVSDHDEARAALAEQLRDQLEVDPASSVRRLKRMPEGIELLEAEWDDLRAELEESAGPRWSLEHARRFDHLTGRPLTRFSRSPAMRLSERLIANGGDAEARDGLLALIDLEIHKLADAIELIDFDALAQSRAEAPLRAQFDPSRQATLARRYEAAALREREKALQELLERHAPQDAKPEPAKPSESVGSFGANPPERPRRARKGRPKAVAAADRTEKPVQPPQPTTPEPEVSLQNETVGSTG